MSKTDIRLDMIRAITDIDLDVIKSMSMTMDNNIVPTDSGMDWQNYESAGRSLSIFIDIKPEEGRRLFGRQKADRRKNDGCQFWYHKEGPECKVPRARHDGYFSHSFDAPGWRPK